jgi:hypothetical protein
MDQQTTYGLQRIQSAVGEFAFVYDPASVCRIIHAMKGESMTSRTAAKIRQWSIYLNARWWHFVGVTIYVRWHSSPA